MVLTVCLLATAALHWAALQSAGRVLENESLGRRAAGVPPRPVQLAARTAPPLATSSADSRPGSLTSGVVPPRSWASPAVNPGAAPSRPGTSPDAPVEADGAADGYRFYSAKEVDVTAEPVSEWNLDAAELDALATSRIVFTLFVGRDGRILHCSVDEPERLSPAQRRSLEARLSGTEMRPALRAGGPVPSRRRVELFAVGGP